MDDDGKSFHRQDKGKRIREPAFSRTRDVDKNPAVPVAPSRKKNYKLSSNSNISGRIREYIQTGKNLPNELQQGLNQNNYERYFRALLDMEELQMEEDIAAYDMYDITMKRECDRVMVLKLHWLAKSKLALVPGDLIAVTPTGSDVEYEGTVSGVYASVVELVFYSQDDFYANHVNENGYDVRFHYNSTACQWMHRALDNVHNNVPKDFLFPDICDFRRTIETYPLEGIPSTINERQKSAIEKICWCAPGGAPYVIYGPPGTGKTKTIVEAIFQLVGIEETCILVCAPSNSASDDLLEKIILRLGDGHGYEILRLNALSRSCKDVKPDHEKFCCIDINDQGSKVFDCPRDFDKYKIIISTYTSSNLLLDGMKRIPFTHIFLDEAGQASEPESMIPLSSFFGAVVVLAGDPKQLGPVVLSKYAEMHGLGQSFLERLCETCPFYRDWDANYVTMLVDNYRSHPHILKVPSDFFYGGHLIACKNSHHITYSLLRELNFVPAKAKGFPIVFIGVKGKAEREHNDTSWFNKKEASKVLQVVKVLTNCEDTYITEDYIGVITPYRRQVNKIIMGMKKLKVLPSTVTCETVEKFQGQEKEVIIVSTVRSSDTNSSSHNLDFLSDPRRFNVAVTRAKSLLIIIGNGDTIKQLPYWSGLLEYCKNNHSYIEG